MSAADELKDLGHQALALAIARYLHDHPPTPAAREWMTADVERWSAATVEEVVAEAARVGAALQAWQARVSNTEPGTWSGYRSRYLSTRHALGSATSGSFATSSGDLNGFLEDVGAPTRYLDVF